MDGRSDPILKRRHWALVILRALAVLMIVLGSVYVIWGLGSFYGMSLGGSTFVSGFMTFWSDMFNPFWFGLSLLIPGIVVQIASRPLARWMVPALVNQCPQCGYTLKNLKSDECPECGYRLRGD